jgi:hypothetical protein
VVVDASAVWPGGGGGGSGGSVRSMSSLGGSGSLVVVKVVLAVSCRHLVSRSRVMHGSDISGRTNISAQVPPHASIFIDY